VSRQTLQDGSSNFSRSNISTKIGRRRNKSANATSKVTLKREQVSYVLKTTLFIQGYVVCCFLCFLNRLAFLFVYKQILNLTHIIFVLSLKGLTNIKNVASNQLNINVPHNHVGCHDIKKMCCIRANMPRSVHEKSTSCDRVSNR